jgi:uncharacterized protein YicC (UPF0701 family)
MRRRELSEKIERHLARGETEMQLTRAAFDLNRQAFERNRQAFERLMAAFDRFDRAFDENQVFMRDMHRRSELVTQQMIRDHQEFMRELKASNEKSDTKSDRILAELKEGREEWREESRAHREALFALIDRLPPPKAA